MLLMLAVFGLYTITSLNDKYAVGKAKYNGPQLAFFMAAGTVLFLLPLLPFADTTVTANPLAAVFVLLLKYHLTYQQTANSKNFLKKCIDK